QELLAEIFSYGAAGPNDYLNLTMIQYNKARAHAPFVYAAVCHAWRSAAMASPRLWHNLCVPRFNIEERPLQLAQVLQCVTVILDRSKSGSIDVIFERLEEDQLEHYSPIITLLESDRLRWRRL
ncbi:hypothetical protein BKA62DRAFT_601128, partial [Auriculariales sp. MPI-PUGE-AT-0066]